MLGWDHGFFEPLAARRLPSRIHDAPGRSSRCQDWCTHERPAASDEVGDCRVPVQPLAIGDVLDGQWSLGRRIGSGATAVVHLGWDEVVRRPVAIKLLRGELVSVADARDRFATEGRVLVRTRHHNVVRMLGRGVHRGRPYIALEYVAGATLLDEIASRCGGVMAVERATDVLHGVIDGVAAVHRAGAVHGDIRAGNVLVRDDGRAVLIGLGHAGCSAPVCRVRHRRSEGTSGVAEPASVVADVSAVAAMAYELFTGRRPTDDAAPLLSELRPDLPRGLDGALRRALCRQPERRTPSIAAFRHEVMRAVRLGTTTP